MQASRNLKRFRGWGAGAILAIQAGCMIPTYQQPQGFSSTYYRHLQQSPPIAAVVAPPSLGEANRELPKSLSTTQADSSKSDSWESWLEPPLTLRSTKTVNDFDAAPAAIQENPRR